MKKAILIIFLGVALVKNIAAQDYKTGIGIRLGYSTGITVKQSLKSNNYIEGILATSWGNGFLVTGLYEWQNPLPTKNLSWYLGVGGHLGFSNYYESNNKYYQSGYTGRYNNYGVIGIDGIIGLEYVFDAAPFGLSLDWKPNINLVGNSRFVGAEIALSARYLIK